MTDTPWHVLAAPVPPSLDHPDAWAMHGAEIVSREVDRDTYGHEDTAYTAQEVWAKLQEQEYARRIRLVAVDGSRRDVGGPEGDGRTAMTADDVVGSAALILPTQGNEHLAHLSVTVRPRWRRQGAGTALLQAAERVATEHGRTTLILETEHGGEPPAGTPGVVEPPHGAGRIDAADPGARMARRHGYVLEQAERYSVLDLPVAPELLERLAAEAATRAGTDYRLVSWTDHAPQEWVGELAVLETRMSTDAPSAGLDLEEEPWDADRVRTYERDIAVAGRGCLVVAAEHVPSGTLAAFTLVEYPWDDPGIVFQEDTLVLREHRGRRLGMLVKADLLRRLAVERPGARRVHTWNAEENAFMLGINEALGFRPAGVAGEWQKKLG